MNESSYCTKCSPEKNFSLGKIFLISRDKIFIILLTCLIYISSLIIKIPERLNLIIIAVTLMLISYRIILRAIKNLLKGRFFDEYFLMSLASISAFSIGEYYEAITIMLLYQIGELLEEIALTNARDSLEKTLSLKVDYVTRIKDDQPEVIKLDDVNPFDIILIKPGEKVGVDGKIIEGESELDLSSLTGESLPLTVKSGDKILSGSINLTGALKVLVEKTSKESTLNKIIESINSNIQKKGKTEKFISKFAKYYTPSVVITAILIALIFPALLNEPLSKWIYRSLILLVISCPCALVISIPLSYFGAIGGASKKGILIKGGKFLDELTKINTIFFDKTGTLTTGHFSLSGIETYNGYDIEELKKIIALAELKSSHPIAKCIVKSFNVYPLNESLISDFKEIPGKGIKARVNGHQVAIGNEKLFNNIISDEKNNIDKFYLYISIDEKLVGKITLEDKIKEESFKTIKELTRSGIKTYILTGDTYGITKIVANKLNVENFYSGLLPLEKVEIIEKHISKKEKVAFVGDGINDAPSIARADVGVAMGLNGIDVAIETADVVLLTHSPYKIVEAINHANYSRKIILQNIAFAIAGKFIFMIIGIAGLAKIWEAIFADVGITLITILNASRTIYHTQTIKAN